MGAPEVTAPAGTALAELAVTVVAARLLDRPFSPEQPLQPALCAIGASFVTLERAGTLRGCIGALDPTRPLYLDVARNAARAMADPRLPALTELDWPELDVTVSVLTRPERLEARGVSELVRAVRPGTDGLILTDGLRRATFLPAVWHKLPTPPRFIAALVAKGGWSEAEAQELTAYRYTAMEFHNTSPRGPLCGFFPAVQEPAAQEPAGQEPAAKEPAVPEGVTDITASAASVPSVAIPDSDGAASQGAVAPKDAA